MAMTTQHIIPIHQLAPAKAPAGSECNGCGVCCLLEPCPMGIVLSARRSGACVAVLWDDATGQYRCGAVVAPQEVLLKALPFSVRWLAPVLVFLLKPVALRWISAGTGCDSELEVIRDAESTTIMSCETMASSHAATNYHD
jgi:hypothetical protein